MFKCNHEHPLYSCSRSPKRGQILCLVSQKLSEINEEHCLALSILDTFIFEKSGILFKILTFSNLYTQVTSNLSSIFIDATFDILLTLQITTFRYEQAEQLRKKSFKIRQKAARQKGSLVRECLIFKKGCRACCVSAKQMINCVCRADNAPGLLIIVGTGSKVA